MSLFLATWIMPAITVALRTVPGLRREIVSTDAHFHRAYVRMIRAAGHRLGGEGDPRFLIRAPMNYPGLYHLLLSYLSERWVERVDRFGGLVYDAIVAVMIGAALTLAGTDASVAILAASLYLIAPGLTLLHIGPRAYSLTPRNFSQFLYALLTGTTLLAAPEWAWGWQAAMAALMAAILLTSKFACQVLLVSIPAASLILGCWEPLVDFALSLPLAVLASRGFFIRQVKDQFGHLSWTARENYAFFARRGDWGRLAGALRRHDIRAIAEEIAFHNPLLSGLLRHLPLFAALVLATMNGADFSAMQATAFAIAVPALGAWLLTSFGMFRIFGEAERYLEFAAPAGWFLLWSLLPTPSGLATAGVLWALFLPVYLANLKLLGVHARRSGIAERAAATDALAAIPHPTVMMVSDVDAHYLYLRTHARLVASPTPLSPPNGDWGFFRRFYLAYPFVHPEAVADLCETYRVTHVLLRRRALAEVEGKHGRSYVFPPHSVVFANGEYMLLALNPMKASG